MERRYWPIQEVRVDGEGEARTVTWYASVFDSLSEDLGGFRELVGRRSFTKTVAESDIRALFNHNPDYVLGRNRSGTLDLNVDLRGLRSKVSPPDTQWARDLMVSVERGDISAGSFGFQVLKDDWRKNDEGEIIRELKEVRLFDVSIVTYPAYPGTEGSASIRSLLTANEIDSEQFTRILAKHRAGIPLEAEEQAEVRSILARLLPEPPEEGHSLVNHRLLDMDLTLMKLKLGPGRA